MEINEFIMFEGTSDENNVFVNVKLLGSISQNGYSYDLAAMEKAVPLYEGVAVYLDHAVKNAPRSYNDRIGYISSPRFCNESIMGNFVLNPHHPRANQIIFDAKNQTPSVGFSHSITADMNPKKKLVESINKVFSVDLVSGPATTKNIFESINEVEAEKNLLNENINILKSQIEELKENNTKLNKALEELNVEFKKIKSKKPEAIAPTAQPSALNYDSFIKKIKG